MIRAPRSKPSNTPSGWSTSWDRTEKPPQAEAAACASPDDSAHTGSSRYSPCTTNNPLRSPAGTAGNRPVLADHLIQTRLAATEPGLNGREQGALKRYRLTCGFGDTCDRSQLVGE